MNFGTHFFIVIFAILTLLRPAEPGTTGNQVQTQAQAQVVTAPYKAETARWRAADGRFAGWQRDGVSLLSTGELQFDPQKAHAGTDPYGPGKYRGGNFYNGATFLVGEAASPVVTPSFPFQQAIPSWNADTPPGTWVEVLLRARTGTGAGVHWTKWYNMGVWTSSQGAVKRHSVAGQADVDGTVDVDTLKLGRSSRPLAATAYQLKVRLFSVSRTALPVVRNASVVVSDKPPVAVSAGTLSQGNPARWGTLLDVPECSQMVYPNGGEAWCSPTSVTMVLNYWQGKAGACGAGVPTTASGVYDRVFDGHGNWPFNAAYASGQTAGGTKLEAYISRFTSLSQAEEWIAAGAPVIISISWGRNQLTGAPIPASAGHLAVLVGFDASGNPILNDPAAPSNGAVQRTYKRAELERQWLQAPGGTVYLVYPAGSSVPRL